MDWRLLCLAIFGLLGACKHASQPARVTQVSPYVVDEVVGRGPLSARVVQNDADLLLYVAGEQDGVVGPCDCSAVPKGAMAQLVSYRKAMDKASPVPGLLVNPGAYFQANTGPVSLMTNKVMLDGLGYASWDALNVTATDLSFLQTQPNHGLALVSANFIAGNGLSIPKAIEKNVGGNAVLITGVSRPTVVSDRFSDPLTALQDVLRPISAQTFVVVLTHGLGDTIPALMKVPGVDLIIDADAHVGHWPGVLEDGVLWVRSRASGVSLREIRLDLANGDLTHGLLRTISMDEEITGDKRLTELARSLQEKLDAVLAQ